MYYYSEDGSSFTSKIKAVNYGLKNNQKIQFYYHDEIYSLVDWKTEPSESIDYYYKEQAQRIRDNYDYVILAYSGGYDSTNILETFHYNNIKLDKIITIGALSQDSVSGVDENHNGELYHNVFPYLKELNLESITQVLDYTTYFSDINRFSIAKYNENWVDEIGAWFSPHNWFWKDIEQYIVPPEWKNKRIALVFGKDKPSLFYDPKSVVSLQPVNSPPQLNSFCFRDTPCMSYADTGTKGDIDRINFYWDPTYTNILVKQLHMINKVYQVSMFSGYFPEIGIQTFSNIDTNTIVYNLKKKLMFKSGKSKTNLISLRDSYLKDKQNSDVYTLYNKGMCTIHHSIGLNNIKPINSKFYGIL